MVVLWSAKSIESEWVYEEASEGRRQGKLVPVMIENVRPPAGFREIQAADLTGWDGSADFDGLRMLLSDLENLLGKRRRQRQRKRPRPSEPMPASPRRSIRSHRNTRLHATQEGRGKAAAAAVGTGCRAACGRHGSLLWFFFAAAGDALSSAPDGCQSASESRCATGDSGYPARSPRLAHKPPSSGSCPRSAGRAGDLHLPAVTQPGHSRDLKHHPKQRFNPLVQRPLCQICWRESSSARPFPKQARLDLTRSAGNENPFVPHFSSPFPVLAVSVLLLSGGCDSLKEYTASSAPSAAPPPAAAAPATPPPAQVYDQAVLSAATALLAMPNFRRPGRPPRQNTRW